MKNQFLHTNDGSIPILQARQNRNNTWDIYTVSEIRGMGNADHNDKLFFDSFEEICAFCSFKGHAYIAVNKNSKWGLFYIESNSPIEKRHYILEEIVYKDLDDLMKKYNLIESEYTIIELGM